MVAPVGGRLFPAYVNLIDGGDALGRILNIEQRTPNIAVERAARLALRAPLSLEGQRESEFASSYRDGGVARQARSLVERGPWPTVGTSIVTGLISPISNSKMLRLESDGVPIDIEMRGNRQVRIPAEERIEQVIKDIRPSVVGLFMEGLKVDPKTGKKQPAKWSGSGFVVSPNDLNLEGYVPQPTKILIATNHHVASGAKTMEIDVFDGGRYPADVKILVSDEQADIAILEVDAPGLNLRPVPIGTADDIGQGQMVLAFGHPYGLPFRVTMGIINNATFEEEGMIQTDAAINFGNSGGPLVDLSTGRVVGMNTYIFDGANTMGFAVPIWQQFEVLRDVWNEQHWKWPAQLL